MAEMPLTHYMLYSTLGSGLWTLFLAFVGRALGENYTLVSRYIGPAGSFILLACLVLAILWVTRRVLARVNES
jgi:membrane protein DedA with SNARE-associated domain